MPVAADPQQHQVEAANRGDPALVAAGFPTHVARVPVQELDPIGRKVDAVEQVAPHEGMVALRVARAQTGELIEIERRRAAEVGTALLVQPHELAVERNRCAAGRQSQHERWPRSKRAREEVRQRATRLAGGE
jgi:hypothetical protein